MKINIEIFTCAICISQSSLNYLKTQSVDRNINKTVVPKSSMFSFTCFAYSQPGPFIVYSTKKVKENMFKCFLQ